MTSRMPFPAGAEPQRLLGSLLLSHHDGSPAPIPSRALVALLEEFGVTEAGCRTALSRAVRRGWMERDVRGRRTHYRLTGPGLGRIREVERQVDGFGARGPAWDGQWTVVAFGIPESERRRRRHLRETLRSAGFAALHDGLWISPRATAGLPREPGVSILRGGFVTGDPARAWDTRRLAAEYRAYMRAFGGFGSPAAARRLSGADALRLVTAAFDGWRRLAAGDPDLPEPVLPPDWPRPAAHAVYRAVMETAGPAARAHIRAVVAAAADGI